MAIHAQAIDLLGRLGELSRFPPLQLAGTFGRDPSNPYYDFLARVVQELEAKRVLELGTYLGASASYMSAARRECHVITVDIYQRPEVVQRLARVAPNVEVIEADTCGSALADRLAKLAPFDLIFFDTDHRYEVVRREWELYSPMLRDGGVALFDDISLNEGMQRFWDEMPGPKMAFRHLHWSGFGVHLKRALEG